jgi:hypothetical protein
MCEQQTCSLSRVRSSHGIMHRIFGRKGQRPEFGTGRNRHQPEQLRHLLDTKRILANEAFGNKWQWSGIMSCGRTQASSATSPSAQTALVSWRRGGRRLGRHLMRPLEFVNLRLLRMAQSRKPAQAPARVRKPVDLNPAGFCMARNSAKNHTRRAAFSGSA